MNLRRALVLIGLIALCEAVGLAGATVTAGAVPGWYATLVLPPFAPPSWLFGPVWTTLYALMGIAAYLVWRAGGEGEGARAASRRALWLFALQLALNSVWTPVFFGVKSIGGGLVVIVLLLAAIGATLIAFARVRPSAAWLLAPYLAWVAFATVLNAAIWILN